jgi:nucleoside-diphosphate-sugar epimerase
VLGHPVVSGLTTLGDEVVALVRSRERAGQILRRGVEVHEGDLLTIPQEQLTALLLGCDAAAHLATALRPGSPGLGTTNTNAALRISGTRRLLDSVLATGVPRYVQQSIAIAYEDGGDRWLDETTPFFRPDDEAGLAQPVVRMEAMVGALDPEKVAWVILRGGSFVGPGTRQDQVIEALKGGALRVPGDGSNWVSFIHSDDYGAAIVAAIHSSVRGEILNVTDEPIRNGDYLDRLAAALGLPEPARDPDVALPRSYRCTSEKARRLLGWAPEIGIWPTARAG